MWWLALAWGSPAGFGCGPPQEVTQFDLVLTWWTDRPQSEVKAIPARSFLDRGASRVDNNMEIVYTLRSFEKFGLMEHVRNVYVVVDDAVLATFGAPRALDFVHGATLVPASSLGVQQHDRGPKWGALHRIPGLSEWFLYSPDDTVLVNQFKLSDFWSSATQKPVMTSYGSWVEGWCNGGRTTGSFHGPVLVNKCWQAGVAAEYSSAQHAPFNWTLAEVDKPPTVDGLRSWMDDLCLYSNAVVSAGLATWSTGDILPAWFFECHTDLGICQADQLQVQLSHEYVRFVNVQGPAMSDERPGGDSKASRVVEVYRKFVKSLPRSKWEK